MMNRLNKIGDVLVIESEVTISGKFVLSNFVDFTNGSKNPQKDLKREFRYSIDGLFWSDWIILTPYNLSKSSVNSERYVTFQVRYTLLSVGAAPVEIQSFSFFGNVVKSLSDMPNMRNSMFNDIWNSREHLELSQNLFCKLYHRGILPSYITRGENRDYLEDEHFIELFVSISKYFALFFLSQEQFENIYDKERLLYEFVRQNTFMIDDSSVTKEELQILTSNYFNEIRKRGTIKTFQRGNDNNVDGEFLRFIRNKEGDEFLVENLSPSSFGWCLGVSSPLYASLTGDRFNKIVDKTFEDLGKHNIVSKVDGSVSNSKLDGYGVLKLSTSSSTGSACGLGYITNQDDVDKGKLIVVDSKIDYKISFKIRVLSSTPTSKLKFGLSGYSGTKQHMIDSFVDGRTGYELVTDFIDTELSIFKEGAWYEIDACLFSYSSLANEEDKLNIGFGENMIFNNVFTKYISPNIHIYGGEAVVMITDFVIQPLVYGTNIRKRRGGNENYSSLGIVQGERILYAYLRNNNEMVEDEELTNIANKYLMPYNQTAHFCIIK